MSMKQRKPPEVTNVLPSSDVARKLATPFSHIEVRERQDGGWRVFYPDPGWIPCAPVCRLKDVIKGHKHDYEQPWIQTNYTPTSEDDAIEWATLLAEGREVKVVLFRTLAERNADRRQLTTT